MTLIIRVPQSLTNPLPDTPVLPPPVLVSDGFGGGNSASVVGRRTDSKLGGLPRTWEGSENMGAIIDGTLQRGTGSETIWFLGVPNPAENYEISFVVKARPSGASLFLDAHRKSPSGSGAPDGYRLILGSGSGQMYVQKRVGGSATTVIAAGSLPTITPGGRYGLRVNSGKLSVVVNDSVVASYTDSTPLPSSGWAGVAGTSTVTAFELDDFLIRAAR